MRLKEVIPAQNNEIARLSYWARMTVKMTKLLQGLRDDLETQGRIEVFRIHWLDRIDALLEECERADMSEREAVE